MRTRKIESAKEKQTLAELIMFKRFITETYPSGIVSIVSDTFDLWSVLTVIMPALKDKILERDGTVVIRPDSGDPVKIISGWTEKELTEVDSETGEAPEDYVHINEQKGVVELLWDTFGGTIVNGYKVLNPNVGAIYGDSITIERAKQISERLMAKGFSPFIVYGIGSFTYQYNTRDTFGMAVKCTAIEHNGKLVEVFKDPITDDGTKKSLKGLLYVGQDNGKYFVNDQVDRHIERTGCLQTIYQNGKLLRETSLSEIRNRINES